MESISQMVAIGAWLFGGFAFLGIAAVGGFVWMTKRHALKGK